jgi:hypothetical protein
MESVEELQDELTLQQVMLSSLEGSGMDDEAREQEQTERRVEIANLKKKLEIARRKGVSTARSNEAPPTSSFEQAGSGKSTRPRPADGWIRLTWVARQSLQLQDVNNVCQQQADHQVRLRGEMPQFDVSSHGTSYPDWPFWTQAVLCCPPCHFYKICHRSAFSTFLASLSPFIL